MSIIKQSSAILILLILLFTIGCVENENRTEPRMGQTTDNQKDEHGCLAAAEYSYDEDIGACIREQELIRDDQKEAAKIAVKGIGKSDTLIILQVEEDDCSGCYVVRMYRGNDLLDVVLNNWHVTAGMKTTSFFTPSECIKMGGRVDTIFDGANCNIDESPVGEVESLNPPSICCVKE